MWRGPAAREKSNQRIFGEGKFRDDFSADQVLLNDALQNFRRAGVIMVVSFHGIIKFR